MKKFTVLLCVLALSAGLYAQEVNMLSKRGEHILPQRGELAFGIDATPVLSFFGNSFNGTNGGNTGAFDFVNGINSMPSSIYVKYYLDDQMAIRGGLRVGLVNNTDKQFVTKDQDIPDPLITVTDKHVFNRKNIAVGADFLKYRGKGRVQGYFGGGLYLNYSSWKSTYTYGNDITTQFNAPTWYDFANGMETSGSSRTLKEYNNYGFGVMARGVIGVEYFFAPKISIGGEMGLGFLAERDGGYRTIERWTGTEIEVVKTERPHDRVIGVDTFVSGSLFIMFHF